MAKQRNLISRPILIPIMADQTTLSKFDELASNEGVKRPDMFQDLVDAEHSRMTTKRTRSEKKNAKV